MLFERDDFYVSGVSVGGADLRFLVRPGDPITVQVLYCRRGHMTNGHHHKLGSCQCCGAGPLLGPPGRSKMSIVGMGGLALKN